LQVFPWFWQIFAKYFFGLPFVNLGGGYWYLGGWGSV